MRDRLLVVGLWVTLWAGIVAFLVNSTPTAIATEGGPAVGWQSWITPATTAATETATATAVVPVPTPPTGPLMDRLAAGKSSVWGKRAFYLVLALVYVMVSSLFLREISQALHE